MGRKIRVLILGAGAMAAERAQALEHAKKALECLAILGGRLFWLSPGGSTRMFPTKTTGKGRWILLKRPGNLRTDSELESGWRMWKPAFLYP